MKTGLFIIGAISAGFGLGFFVKFGLEGLSMMAQDIFAKPQKSIAISSDYGFGGSDNNPLSQEEYDFLLKKDGVEDFPGNKEETKIKKSISTLEDPEIPDTGKAIVADLDLMKLLLYEDGVSVKEFTIKSKGKQGSAWETPPGVYDIKYKTENHFSSIGNVWMPYSMQFFGNFFIHGWPYYPDGTPVPEGYSGGCIRIPNEEMKEIYEYAEVGTKMIVIGGLKDSQEEFAEDNGYYEIKKRAGAFPSVTSKSYIVGDLDTGEIIAHKNSETPYAIASITKLMTALVSLETVNQFQKSNISSRAINTNGTAGDLSVGQDIETGDLIYPLLLESSNDAAEAIAEHIGRSYFLANMNGKAKAIGLENTIFEDPSGLSAKNVSTAQDLFTLAQYIHKFKSYIFYITQLQKYTVDGQTWYNNNAFRNDKFFRGGKNGYTTAAKKTLLTTVELPLVDGGTRNIAVIVLQSEGTERDTRRILDYVNSNVEYVVDEEE